MAFESAESGLRLLEPFTAAITTALIVPTGLRYLAVWRFTAEVDVRAKRSRSVAPPGHTWEQVKRTVAPGAPSLFVPAFVLSRMVVMQLGVRLVQAQPHLILERGIPEEVPQRPRLVVEGSVPRLRLTSGSQALEEAADDGPGFGTLSPIVLDQEDAERVAHFVYLALEARMTPDLRGIDYDLELSDARLLFLPAAFDPRHVHDCNWRFLLREFDGVVA